MHGCTSSDSHDKVPLCGSHIVTRVAACYARYTPSDVEVITQQKLADWSRSSLDQLSLACILCKSAASCQPKGPGSHCNKRQ